MPLVVLSNNDGCVIARSNEAKALGITMGEPWHMVRERLGTKIPRMRSSNYTLCGDMSACVMRILADFTPDLELYSIDEAFLGLAGFELQLEKRRPALRQRVLQWTGIPVSVGIAAPKTLAKVANYRAKKDQACAGVCMLFDDAAIDAELGRLPLTDIWGIAGRLARRLTDIGITSPLALKQTDARFIRERFSVTLERTVRELQGIPCIAFEEAPPDRKAIMASRPHGDGPPRDGGGRRQLRIRAAEKMRRQDLAAGRVMVFVQTNPFRPQDAQYARERMIALPVATADTAIIIAGAQPALGTIWRSSFTTRRLARCCSTWSKPTACRAGCLTGLTAPSSRDACARSTNSTAASAAIPSAMPLPACGGACGAAVSHHAGSCWAASSSSVHTERRRGYR